MLFVTASMLMTAQRDLSCWNHMLAVSLLLYPCFCRNGGMFFLLCKAPFILCYAGLLIRVQNGSLDEKSETYPCVSTNFPVLS